MICQATRSKRATVTVPSQSPDGPYHLSADAAERLRAFALRPVEWFNLAVIHGPFEFYLHDDFYTEQGDACQPEREVLDAALFPCPTLDDCSSDAPRLLDFALTRWWLESDVVSALREHEATLLELIEGRFNQTKNEFFHFRLVEVAGTLFGEQSAEWFRSVLSGMPAPIRLGMLYSGYWCLPPVEGLSAALQALSDIPPTKLASVCMVLAQFQSPIVLDWIEANVHDPLTRQWGDLAAASGIDWARTAKWLQNGRPLSLVALDALVVCAGPRPGASLLIRKLNPRLQYPASASVIEAAVTDYARRDRVPRVEGAVNRILAALPVLAARSHS